MDNEKSFTEAIEAKVNVHGELHLDKVQTEILIRWLKVSEGFEKRTNLLIDHLQETIAMNKGGSDGH